MAHDNRTPSEPKFTRGEKCIFIHLVLTFVMIMVLVIVYGLHLYLVSHTQYSIFNTRRSISDPIQNSRKRGSVMISTRVRRSIAHPYFDRDSFANNIGLLEHTESLPTQAITLNNAAVNYVSPSSKMFIVGWEPNVIEHNDKFINGPNNYAVYYINKEDCLEVLTPIVLMRNYEFCVTLQKNSKIVLEYGAVIFNNTKPIGFFSWGESIQTELPLVIVNDTLFQDWLIPLINF
ncbi:uncharacterized protein [Epargyreus clarus]|uniref:uncharacterized protein isoform X3 n=1 Tax=Epargyreus clarus TaxID=520877 RepID=UPI003C2F1376